MGVSDWDPERSKKCCRWRYSMETTCCPMFQGCNCRNWG